MNETTGDTTEHRIVKNNRTFRDANEQIRERAEEYQAPLERIPFLCECPQPNCVQIVRLTFSEYSAVRANPRHFFTARGHETEEKKVGKVVADGEDYLIIEKDRTAVEE
jgi:hypothetical protein